MKIVKLNASFSCKKQIRQYEPIDIFMAVEAEVDMDTETKTIAEMQNELFEIAKSGVDDQIERLTGQRSTPKVESQPASTDGDLPF